MLRGVIIVLLLLLPGLLQAQDTASITGTVTSAETGEPLIGAHVFIASSMRGTVTDEAGHFRLDLLRTGAHRLHVSMLGYRSENLDTLLREPDVYEIDVTLAETVIETEEIVVEGERDRQWQRRYERFIEEFIGESDNAEKTEILNPEVLSFSGRWGVFRAEADEPLIIENRALGYRITYYLKDFSSTRQRIRYDGDPLFEELTPEDSAQAAEWERRREDVYYGSFRHFLRAAIADQLEEEGFLVFRRPREDLHLSLAGAFRHNPRRPAGTRHFLRDGDHEDEYRLRFQGYLEIIYTESPEPEAYLAWSGERRRPMDRRHAKISLRRGSAEFDQYGKLVDPYSVTGYRYYAFTRVADALPKEYWPERSNAEHP